MLWCTHFEEVVGIIITKIEALTIPQVKHEGDNILYQIIENKVADRLAIYLIPIQSTELFIVCSIIKGWTKGTTPYRDCSCKKYQICFGCCKCSSDADKTISWRILHNEITSTPINRPLMLCWEDKRKKVVVEDDFVPEVELDETCVFTKKVIRNIMHFKTTMRLRGEVKRYNSVHHCFRWEE